MNALAIGASLLMSAEEHARPPQPLHAVEPRCSCRAGRRLEKEKECDADEGLA